MRKLGVVAFWLTYPAIWLALFVSHRTRVLLIHDDQFLVVKGWLGPDHWSLPGGGLHRGEEPRAGAIREVLEETGIDLSTGDLTHAYQARHKGSGLRFTYDCFVCHLHELPEITPQPGEIVAYQWVPLVEPGVRMSADAAAALSWWKSQS